jgi:MFS family permease
MVTWMCCAAVSGILSFSWITVTQGKGGIIVIAVFWGFCSAGLVTLPAAVFPDICPDPRRLGTRTGMSWGISAFSSLIGPPIAGALLKDTGNFPDGEQPASKFLGPQIFSGCTLLFGSFLIAILWAVTLKQKKK